MLKGTAEAITPTVTHLFNLSLKSGEVPEAWKTSSVVSIPKTHRPSDNPIDYRPISLLSTLSKLLEKHVYKLLWQHLNANGLVSDSQWGFCPSRSTVTALLSTLHAIFQLLEKGSDMCLIFWNVRVYAPSNMYCMQSGLRYLQMRHLHFFFFFFFYESLCQMQRLHTVAEC